MRFCRSCRRIYREDHDEFCSADGTPLEPVTEEHDPLVGVEIDGRFHLTERLGAGGYGVVYVAEQVGLKRPVAVKMLYAERSKDARAVRRFAREARVLASLDHPGLVRVHDYSTSGGLPYLVMDLLEGQPLSRVIQPGGVPPRHAVHVLAMISDAIDAAHRAGVVHRDLKPENAILDVRDGRLRVRLIDFGLAIVAPEDGGSETRLTRDGTVIGTPEYMAPEQILGREADGRTDLYALGVVAYELLTGMPPFTSDDASETVVRHLEEAPPPLEIPGASGPVVRELAALVMRLLAKRSEERPSTGELVAKQLRKIEGRLPDAGPPVRLLETSPGVPLGGSARAHHDTDEGSRTQSERPPLPEPASMRKPPSEGPFTGLGADSKVDALLERTLSAQRRGRTVRVAIGIGALVLLGVLLVPFLQSNGPIAAAPPPTPAPQPIDAPAVELQPQVTPVTEEAPSSAGLPFAGTIEVPGGEPQREYEASLRALQSELSRIGLRPRDVRSSPVAARAWTAQTRAAGQGNYGEAVTQLESVRETARSKRPREWMVYRLQREERRLGEAPAPEAQARLRALWQLLDRTSDRPADVRSFMSRVDGLGAP